MQLEDLNVQIAGFLLDMSVVSAARSRHSGLGYRRAAYVVFSLEWPVADLVRRGRLRDIRGIGPAVERIVLEAIARGASPTVESSLAQAPASVKADIERRRSARRGYLSRASVRAALHAEAPTDVVSAAAYNGDFHIHTIWSDGAQSVETMALESLARGWTRLCVTDHSYGLPIAGGMSMDAVTRQHLEIDRLNAELKGRFRVWKGIEANILADGSLDLSREELARFELVVAAPHSALRRADDQTARMLAAVRQPGVHILGHPRGRMFNTREGVRADWDAVFSAAAENGVAIELDGTWDRQDVDAALAARALAAGCLFAIDSDAHSPRELAYVEYALAHARLARIPAERVINCWSDKRLEGWRKGRTQEAQKHKKRKEKTDKWKPE